MTFESIIIIHVHFVLSSTVNSVLSTRQMKLRPLKGDVYTIPASVSLTNGSKVTLKVYCAVAVVPHLSLRSGRKIPANRLCKHVNVSTPPLA